MSRAIRSDAGFTLVEALVSLFVFSLIAAGCTALLMQSVRSQRSLGEAHEQLRELQNARALLEADLGQIALRQVRTVEGARRPAFIGGDDETAMAFVRASAEPDPDHGARTRLAYVEYRIEEDRLVRVSRTHLDAIVDTPSAERVVLTQAKDIRFEFFDGVTWRPQWVAVSRGAPRAVALVATLPRYGEVRIETLAGAGA